MGSRNLQRDTPFLDRLGFGGGTGRRGSCACVRVPLWSFRKENQKKKKNIKKNWNQKETQRCNCWEKQTRQSRQWKASEEQFKKMTTSEQQTRQWEQVEVKRLNHLQIPLWVESRKQKQSVSSILLRGSLQLATGKHFDLGLFISHDTSSCHSSLTSLTENRWLWFP